MGDFNSNVGNINLAITTGNYAELERLLLECASWPTRILITDISFTRPGEITLSEFKQPFEFHRCTFKAGLTIHSGKFQSSFRFRDCTFTDNAKITFTNSEFNQGLSLENVQGKAALSIKNSLTNQAAFQLSIVNNESYKILFDELEILGCHFSQIGCPRPVPVIRLIVEGCRVAFPLTALFSAFQNSESVSLRNNFIENGECVVVGGVARTVDFSSTTFLNGFLPQNFAFLNLILSKAKLVEGLAVFRGCSFAHPFELCLEAPSVMFAQCSFSNTLLIGPSSPPEILIHGSPLLSSLTTSEFHGKKLTIVGSPTLKVGAGIVLHNSTFEEGIYFSDLSIQTAISVSNVHTQNFQMSAVSFEGPALFSAHFISAPDFYRSTLYFDSSFEGSTFFDLSDRAQGRYRNLKHLFSEISHEVEEHRFAALEMRSRHLSLKSRAEKLISYFYGHLNNYGFDFLRPGTWLCALFVVSICVFYLCPVLNFHADERGPLVLTELNYRAHLLKALVMSAYNTIGPLKFYERFGYFDTEGLKSTVYSVVQTILATILWFFLLLGLRKRFKAQ